MNEAGWHGDVAILLLRRKESGAGRIQRRHHRPDRGFKGGAMFLEARKVLALSGKLAPQIPMLGDGQTLIRVVRREDKKFFILEELPDQSPDHQSLRVVKANAEMGG